MTIGAIVDQWPMAMNPLPTVFWCKRHFIISIQYGQKVIPRYLINLTAVWYTVSIQVLMTSWKH